MSDITHIFAGDPLDRADHQRRDGQWLEQRMVDPGSRYLLFDGLRVLADRGPPTTLYWVGTVPSGRGAP